MEEFNLDSIDERNASELEIKQFREFLQLLVYQKFHV